eukprot:COSAG01_NODE_4736_length_4783_cov_24.168019_1_plen_73_part_00
MTADWLVRALRHRRQNDGKQPPVVRGHLDLSGPQRIYGGAMRCDMAPFAGPAASGMSASRLLDMPLSRGSPY